MNAINNIPAHELNWTEKPVIGLVLINAVHDSNRLLIEPFAFYDVAKHESGMIVIVKHDHCTDPENCNHGQHIQK